jgi:hypothetical protein
LVFRHRKSFSKVTLWQECVGFLLTKQGIIKKMASSSWHFCQPHFHPRSLHAPDFV